MKRRPQRKKPPGRAAWFETVCLCGQAKSTRFRDRTQVLAIRDRLLSIAARTLADTEATRPELSGARTALLEIMPGLLLTENYTTAMMLRALFDRRAQMDLAANEALLHGARA